MDPKQHTLSDTFCHACASSAGCLLPGRLELERLTLEEFWHVHGDWSRRAFGPDGPLARGPRGPLKHLVKEIVREILPATADGSIWLEPGAFLEEFVDLVLLVFDATRRAGFTVEQVVAGCCQKLKKNMARSWPPVGNLNEPVEHFRTASEKSHAGVDHLTELWAITNADCEDDNAEGIAGAALKMIDRLERQLLSPHRLAARADVRVTKGLSDADRALLSEAIQRSPDGVAVAVEPPPIPVDGVSVHDVVAEDIAERKASGLGKYGVELRAGDGRRSLVDSYQELLDHVIYFRKYMIEHGIGVPSAAKAR